MKLWRPDTCASPHDTCIVEEIYVGTTITGMGRVIRKCSVHVGVADQDLYGVLITNPDSEQKRKNRFYRLLLGLEGEDLNLAELNEDGALVLKRGIGVSWTFTGSSTSRVLAVTVSGVNLTTNQKNRVVAKLEQLFGVGRVTVEYR